jgi:hypothetical protein
MKSTFSQKQLVPLIFLLFCLEDFYGLFNAMISIPQPRLLIRAIFIVGGSFDVERKN